MITFANSKNSLFNVDQSIISTQTTIDMLNGRIAILQKYNKRFVRFIIVDIIALVLFASGAAFEILSDNYFSAIMYSISVISLTATVFYLKYNNKRNNYYLNSLQNSLEFYVNNMNALRSQDAHQVRKTFDDLIE